MIQLMPALKSAAPRDLQEEGENAPSFMAGMHRPPCVTREVALIATGFALRAHSSSLPVTMQARAGM